ncbi:MAG: DUF2851 family protein [Sphingobacteriales bacterium]
MNERLLQYIWQMQLFNKASLVTVKEESLQIIFPGNCNSNQGPDFLEAKIKIVDTILAGSIEVHVKSSDWNNHKHSSDKNYNNVVLHVVWEDDNPLIALPTLVLNNRVSKLLLNKYEELMQSRGFVPCENSIVNIHELVWHSWKERLLVDRLQKKSQQVLDYLEKSSNHWEEVFWWTLAGNFGIKVNKDCFEAIAQSVPVNLLAKHKHSIHQLEALLLGQAGLLNKEFQEEYPKLLRREYDFCKTKYQLKEIAITPSSLRMRPSSFPVIRLAQLAMLVHQSLHLFSKIKESESLIEIKKMLDVTANDYWHYHFAIDEPSSYKPKHLGAQMVDIILINTVIPVLFSYGHYYNETVYKDKALKWLEQIKAEKNNITKNWMHLSIVNQNAFDSQSLIELKTNYCDKRRCLECAIGNALLRKSTS